jgi:hypothetical protein
LDGKSSGHGGDLLNVPPQWVGEGLGEEWGQVEQAEHDGDRSGGVADGGGDAEGEQGDQDEVADAAGGGAQGWAVAD